MCRVWVGRRLQKVVRFRALPLLRSWRFPKTHWARFYILQDYISNRIAGVECTKNTNILVGRVKVVESIGVDNE